MPRATANPPQPITSHARWVVVLLALPPIVLALWMSGWTGKDAQGNPLPGAHADFLWALFTSLPWTAAWLAAAWGYGWGCCRWILRWHEPSRPRRDRSIEIGLGIAVLLVLGITAGTLGVMQLAGSLGAWFILLAGLALLVARAALARPDPSIERSNWFALAWIAAVPAVAVLILAACSAPGWLWRTEFGGYDALSYHLQLPREWLDAGRIQGVTHNVYSFFPSYVESAYYHLAVLMGDGIHAAYACQLLHAGITIIAAWLTSRVAFHYAGKIAGFCAFVAMLGTPWVIVTGSLAYNEMAVVLLLATGLLVLRDRDVSAGQRAAIVGFIAGVACGAKLTSIGFVALPLAAAALMFIPARKYLLALTLGAALFALAMLPFVLRNWIETGSPLFPFAADVLGTGHFTAEQARIWSEGHAPSGGFADRLRALWDQFMRFGIGPNPNANEPWVAQWSILPWLGLVGISLSFTRPRIRFSAALLVVLLALMIGFWLAATHLKSRFLLPSIVPLAIGAGLGAATIDFVLNERISRVTNVTRGAMATVGFVIVVAWCSLPIVFFANEPSPANPAPAGRVGRVDFFTGEAFPKHERPQLASVSHVIAINELPGDAHTLLVGEAAPFYLTGEFAYQTTWDRGPISEVMRDHPDQPARWIEALRGQGFTHLFVNASMLERWERAGWNDPLITAERVGRAAEQHAERVQVTPAGVLYRLQEQEALKR